MISVKDIRNIASSATSIKVCFCKSRQDALNGEIYKEKYISKYDDSDIDDLKVEYIYPSRKDDLEVFVVKKDLVEDILNGRSVRESISRFYD